MVRHPSRIHVCRPRNLSHNTTGIYNAASICLDEILNIKHVVEWEHILQRKQERINHNNKRENMQRKNHQYKVGDKILFKRKKNYKHELYFMGSFPITQINDNVTVLFQKGIINDATNISQIRNIFWLNNKKSFHNTSCFI